MKKLSFILALACLLSSFAFAEVVCKDRKLFFKEGNNFYPAVYGKHGDNGITINFYDKNGESKQIGSSENDVLILRTCPELREKHKQFGHYKKIQNKN